MKIKWSGVSFGLLCVIVIILIGKNYQVEENSVIIEEKFEDNAVLAVGEERIWSNGTTICGWGYTEDFGCDGLYPNRVRQKYIKGNCTRDWYYYKDCNEECIEGGWCLPREDGIKTDNVSNSFNVTKIIDGENFEISTGERVHLLCINSSNNGGEDFLKEVIGREEVELVGDVTDKDEKGRLLRYVYFEGKFVNELIVKEGWASFSVSNNYNWGICGKVKEAENSARALGNGMWKRQDTYDYYYTSSCYSDIYNCEDFYYRIDAQRFYDATYEDCGRDVHHLDGDYDRVVCENFYYQYDY